MGKSLIGVIQCAVTMCNSELLSEESTSIITGILDRMEFTAQDCNIIWNIYWNEYKKQISTEQELLYL